MQETSLKLRSREAAGCDIASQSVISLGSSVQKIRDIMMHRADAVADGREVIQALERQDYYLVLMDIKMPEMDGITAAKVIRKLRPENGPKIIAITAFALGGDREKCLEAGINDYISKPVKISDLVDVLRKCKLSRVVS